MRPRLPPSLFLFAPSLVPPLALKADLHPFSIVFSLLLRIRPPPIRAPHPPQILLHPPLPPFPTRLSARQTHHLEEGGARCDQRRTCEPDSSEGEEPGVREGVQEGGGREGRVVGREEGDQENWVSSSTFFWSLRVGCAVVVGLGWSWGRLEGGCAKRRRKEVQTRKEDAIGTNADFLFRFFARFLRSSKSSKSKKIKLDDDVETIDVSSPSPFACSSFRSYRADSFSFSLRFARTGIHLPLRQLRQVHPSDPKRGTFFPSLPLLFAPKTS